MKEFQNREMPAKPMLKDSETGLIRQIWPIVEEPGHLTAQNVMIVPFLKPKACKFIHRVMGTPRKAEPRRLAWECG